MEQKEFKFRCEQNFETKPTDSAAIIYLLKSNKKLFIIKENQTVFYYLPYEDEKRNEFLAEK